MDSKERGGGGKRGSRAASGAGRGRAERGRSERRRAEPPAGRRPEGRAAERARASSDRPGGLAALGAVNYALLGVALVAIVVGYVLLDRGSITAAPLLLVLGYVVLIPAGLLVGSRAPPDS